MESLLGQGGREPESPSESHPDGSWRADALGRSRHARLTDLFREPLDDRDPERAARICAEACRELLRDFAPALVWLPLVERSRLQALVVYARMAFDFAGQSGVEGERLAALNRLEFTLEEALASGDAGQPVYLRMAAEERRLPWPQEALDAIVAAARRRIVAPRAESIEVLEHDSESLARAMAWAATGTDPEAPVVRLGGVLLRLHGLLDLGEAIRRDRVALPPAELPSRGNPSAPLDEAAVERALRRELARLAERLPGPRELRASAPPGTVRSLLYARLAARSLAGRLARLGARGVRTPPVLGAGTRLALLLRTAIGRG